MRDKENALLQKHEIIHDQESDCNQCLLPLFSPDFLVVCRNDNNINYIVNWYYCYYDSLVICISNEWPA